MQKLLQPYRWHYCGTPDFMKFLASTYARPGGIDYDGRYTCAHIRGDSAKKIEPLRDIA